MNIAGALVFSLWDIYLKFTDKLPEEAGREFFAIVDKVARALLQVA